MLEAAMFPQKYDGRSLPPEVNQGCGEGRRGGELRVHTEEAPMVEGGSTACLCLAVAGGVDRRSEWSLSPGCMR